MILNYAVHARAALKWFEEKIGLKMLVVALGVHIPIWFSLIFVGVVLVGSVVASLLFARETDSTIHVDLPPDFDLPLLEDAPEDLESADVNQHKI